MSTFIVLLDIKTVDLDFFELISGTALSILIRDPCEGRTAGRKKKTGSLSKGIKRKNSLVRRG